MFIIRTIFYQIKVITIEINHNPNWPYISDHPSRILIIGGSGSGKTNVLLNLIKHKRRDIDKISLYLKDH